MLKIYFILIAVFTQTMSFSQTTVTKYFKDPYLQKETSAASASFSLVVTKLENGKSVREVKNLKENLLIRRESEHGEQLGIWNYKTKKGYTELNFDFDLLYTQNECIDTIKDIYIQDYFKDSTAIDYTGAKILNEVAHNSTNQHSDEILFQFISSNIVYPKYALENAISGKVILTFTVSKAGLAANIAVKKGVHVSLDKEAVRLVKLLRFLPSTYKGQPVDFCMTLPISFELEE